MSRTRAERAKLYAKEDASRGVLINFNHPSQTLTLGKLTWQAVFDAIPGLPSKYFLLCTGGRVYTQEDVLYLSAVLQEAHRAKLFPLGQHTVIEQLTEFFDLGPFSMYEDHKVRKGYLLIDEADTTKHKRFYPDIFDKFVKEANIEAYAKTLSPKDWARSWKGEFRVHSGQRVHHDVGQTWATNLRVWQALDPTLGGVRHRTLDDMLEFCDRDAFYIF